MRAALVAVVLIAPACDGVFGLERDAVKDAAAETVSGRWMLIYATNRPDGTPEVKELPAPGARLTVQLTTEQPIEVPLEADGTFAFTRPPGAPYRLTALDALGGQPIEIQHDAAQLDLATRYAGRFERAGVTQTTTLTFGSHAVPGIRVIQSTGLWSETAMTGDMLDWHLSVSAGGTRGLLDASKNDRIWYVLRQIFNVGPNSYTAIAAEAEGSVTIVDGVPLAVPITPMTHTLDSCVQLVAHRANQVARVVAAVPGATMPGDDWYVASAPAQQLGPVGALSLAYTGEAGFTGTDAAFTVAYRNPFPGTSIVVSMGAAAQRLLTYPGATSLGLSIGQRVWQRVSSCAQPVIVDAIQAMPGTITLDGVELASDGVTIPIQQGPRVALAWNLSAPGPNDFTIVTIYEVTNLAGDTALIPVGTYLTIDRTVSLATSTLVPGHYYLVRLDGLLGIPGARQGDLRTVAYPYSSATQFSRMFRVVP